MAVTSPCASDSPATWVRYRVLAALCSAAIVAYIHRNSLGVAEKTIRQDLGLTETQMGYVLSAFFLTYAVCQIPTGILSHGWGTRRSLGLYAFLWSACTAGIGLAGGYGGLLAARLGMGAAQAGIFPASTSSIARWLPATRRALASGWLAGCMSIGGALGALLTGLLLEPLGWRWLFVVFGLPGLAWSVWFFAWFRDDPGQHPAVNAAERELLQDALPLEARKPAAAGRQATPWAQLLTSPAMGWICAQQFFRAAGYMFFASWFATYLQESRGISVREAGVLTSLPLWGVVLGSLVGGALSDWLLERTGSRRLSRQGLAVASLLVCAVLTVLASWIEGAWPAVLLISAGSFCASVAGPCAYVITIDMGGHHVAPVFSTMNMAGNLGAMALPIVVPQVVQYAGSWDTVLFFFGGLYVAAAACWLLLDLRGTVFDQALVRRPP